MLKRLIARLDVKNGSVIKGIQLEGLRVVGEVPNMAEKYYFEGADEILVLDAVASLYGRQATLEAVRSATRRSFIPVTLGGGVRAIADAVEMFGAGADRVAINSAALSNPGILRQIAETYGAQAVVVSIEAKRVGQRQWNCFYESGREDSGISVSDWIARLQAEHVGEILITSVDKDGGRKGVDLELLDRVRGITPIPIIYSGGVSHSTDVVETLRRPDVSGVAIGAALHYGSLKIDNLKADLKIQNISVPEVFRCE